MLSDRQELREKIYRGVKSAVDKLIAARAKDDDYLIISENGKIVKVPAKTLIKRGQDKG